MRGTGVFYGRGRRWCRTPLTLKEMEMTPFKEISPLQLKNSVSEKSDKGVDVSCLQEMAVMFACMKKNDFREAKCADEITSFEKCYTDHTAKKQQEKQREESGQLVTGSNVRNITTKQLNKLLAKYPQFNEKL